MCPIILFNTVWLYTCLVLSILELKGAMWCDIGDPALVLLILFNAPGLLWSFCSIQDRRSDIGASEILFLFNKKERF